jgi:DNA-binding NarL/FixJ family response regulator
LAPAGQRGQGAICPDADHGETEVARLAGKGLLNPEIAAELYVIRKAIS